MRKLPVFTLITLVIMSTLLIACHPGFQQAPITGRDDLVAKKIGAQLVVILKAR